MRDEHVALRRVMTALADRPDATTAALARALGVSRATLHRRFPSRVELVRSALAQALVDLRTALDEVTRGPGVAALDCLRGAVEALVPLGPQARLLLSHEADLDRDPDLRRRGDELVARVQTLVDGARRAGDLDVTAPAAWQVRALVDLVWAAWAAVRDGDVGHRAAGQLAWRTFYAGCRPGRTGEPS
jgi:TetR/AcrR family transcriptional regulator, mexCD-oprJ operon repressor